MDSVARYYMLANQAIEHAMLFGTDYDSGELASNLYELGDVYSEGGDHSNAAKYYSNALNMYNSILEQNPKEYAQEISSIIEDLSDEFEDANDTVQQLSFLKKLCAEYEVKKPSPHVLTIVNGVYSSLSYYYGDKNIDTALRYALKYNANCVTLANWASPMLDFLYISNLLDIDSYYKRKKDTSDIPLLDLVLAKIANNLPLDSIDRRYIVYDGQYRYMLFKNFKVAARYGKAQRIDSCVYYYRAGIAGMTNCLTQTHNSVVARNILSNIQKPFLAYIQILDNEGRKDSIVSAAARELYAIAGSSVGAKYNPPKEFLNYLYITLSYYSLFTKQPNISVSACLEGLKFDSSQEYLYTNLALGYLFTGRKEKAMDIYKRYRGKPFVSKSFATWNEAFLDDIATLEKAGITTDDFGEVKRFLAK